MAAADPPSAAVERDALTFLEALHGQRPNPSVIVVSTANGSGWGSRFPLTPKDALPMVVGAVDTYVRITPIEHALKGRKRGLAEHSVSLPGVWVEIDVNGTPDGNGGVKRDACPTFEAAEEIAGCVLEPTMLVGSGGGVHGYYLFDKPLLLDDDDARARAAALVEGWQRRLRNEAKERHAGLDSTHDLARVLRPPGSFNGKGPEPRLVELLDDGGRRYTVDEIEAEIAPVKPRAHKVNETPGDGDPGRSVEELLRKYPKLKALAAHEGRAPGDGTGHAWDWALCCEAMREPRSCTDIEASALLRHARRGDPKGGRDDYIERTVAKARAKVGGEAERVGPPAMAPAQLISQRWGIADKDPIVSGYLIGDGRDAIVKLRRQSGEIMRIERLALLFDKAAHNREASIVARSQFPALKPDQAHEVAQAVIELCQPEPMSDAEEGIDLLYGVLDDLDEIVSGVMGGTAEQQWAALVSRRNIERELRAKPGGSHASVGIRDEQDRAWLPASTVRAAAGFPTWGALNALVREAGWGREPVEQWEPGVNRAQADRVRRRVFYVEPRETE